MPSNDVADTVLRAVRAEFSDVADLEQATRLVVRLSLAMLLGFLLGYEREAQGKAAGVRTHMLVALGAALFVLLPAQMGMPMADMSRVVQGLVAGVGFLCAGTILKQERREGAVIEGLTTAAGLWVTAAIGMACGLGREVTAIIASLMVLLVMALMPHLFAQRPVPREPAPPRREPAPLGDGPPPAPGPGAGA